MARFLCLWELDRAAIPRNPQGWIQWEDLVKEVSDETEKGFIKDWGQFVGELNGYAIFEGSEHDVTRFAQRLITLVSLKIRPIASLDEVGELIRALTGSD